MAVSAGLLMVLRSQMGFFLDDWGLVIYREDSPTDWLLPHNEHIVVLPAAIYKLSLAVFGMTPFPLHLLAVALFITSVALLFQWIRPLVGDPLAVLGCAVILFLGAATEDLVWAFQMGYFGSVAGGLGALLLLRLETKRADLAACGLLVIAVLFSSLAIPFLAGAAVQLAIRNRAGRSPGSLLRDCWVYVVPAAVFAVWFLGWGHEADSALSLENLIRDPIYALSGFGYSAFALTGAFRLSGASMADAWALPGLLLTVGIGLVLYLRRRVHPAFLVAAGIALTFWVLSGLNFIPGREFFNSRYQYPGAVFLLMVLAGTFEGVRPDWRIVTAIGAVAATALTVNVIALIDSFNETYRPYAERNRTVMTSLDLSARTVDRDLLVGVSDDGNAKVNAGSYLDVAGEYGPAGWSESEIPGVPADNREQLDRLLVLTLPIRLVPAGALRKDGNCRTLEADPEASRSIRVDSPFLLLDSERQVNVLLGRFGEGTTTPGWFVPGGSPTGYVIPRDNAREPWRIAFSGTGKVQVCPARASG